MGFAGRRPDKMDAEARRFIALPTIGAQVPLRARR